MVVIWEDEVRSAFSLPTIVGIYQYKPMKMIKKWGFTNIAINSLPYSLAMNPKTKKEVEVISLKKLLLDQYSND